jgi:hypothetical protein
MKKKILIIVKTNPNLSKKYGELVCTAGIDEYFNWFRLYPIPFRNLDKKNKYKKYQWIETEIEKDLSDSRPESYKIIGEIKPLEVVSTENNWQSRKKLVLHNVFLNKKQLIYDCKISYKKTSLAIFKPTNINEFIIKDVDKINETYTLPFKFYYKFKDNENKISILQIIDWEIGELTRKLLKQYGNNLEIIKSILKKKYFYDMTTKRDIYLFLGTNKIWQLRKSKNPFMIIGIFYPPIVN